MNNTWNTNLLIELVGAKIMEEIMRSVLTGRRGQDVFIWKSSLNEIFSTASVWEVVRRKSQNVLWYEWFGIMCCRNAFSFVYEKFGSIV